MQRNLFCLLAFAIAIGTHAQGTLVLRNGKTLAYTREKQSGEFVTITDSGKKREVLRSNVKCYCPERENEYFILSGKEAEEANKHASAVGRKPTHSEFKRELTGRINFYKWTEQIAGPTTNSATGVPTSPGYSVGYIFLQKDGKVFQVYASDLFRDKSEARRKFESMIKDDPETLALVGSDEFKMKPGKIEEVVGAYNLRKFEKPEKKDFGKLGSVGFYTKVRSRTEQDLVLKVNDSLEYKLSTKNTITVPLPTERASKVCLVSESGSLCELLIGSACMMKTYELKFNANNNSYSIEQKKKKDLQEHILLMK